MRVVLPWWIAVMSAGAVPAQQWAFEQPGWLTAVHSEAAAGDFDGDGDQDLAVAGFPFGVRVLRNDGTGSFVDVTSFVQPGYLVSVTGLCFLDVDADGRDELFASAYGGNVLFGTTPAGSWVNRSAGLPAGLGPVYAIAGDFDSDGDQDLVAAGISIAPSYNTLLSNVGNGTFTSLPFPLAGPYAGSGHRVTAGDIDNDGDLDVLFARPPQLLRNNGNNVFTHVTATQLGTGAYADLAAFGDLDGDGDRDLALTDTLNGNSQILRNNGAGTFSIVPGAVSLLPSTERSLLLVDVDEDGDLDLVRTQQNGPPVLSRNLGTGIFVDDPAAMPAGAPANRVAVAFDADGDRDADLLLSGLSSPGGVLLNQHRQVRLPQAPQIGQPWPVDVWHEPGYATAPRTCWLGRGLAMLPQPFVLLPFGRLWLDLSAPVIIDTLMLPTGLGPTTVVLTIPNLPPLVGLSLHVQALVEGPLGLPSARFTNVASRVIQ